MRKVLIISVLALLSLSVKGQLDTINTGTGANTGTGDPLRTALIKVNDAINLLNYTHLYIITGTGDTIATRAYARSVGDTNVYPGAGIALSTGSAWGSSITNNSTNWNTAYTDRLKWDGGSTDLVAATGRTSLGATTVGSAFFTLANPSAIRIPIIQADNSITATATTGTGNVVLSASPTLSGTVALGSGSLTMTGSLAATGSRVLKGWFTDLEITNLPTINGGTLKAGLGFTTVGNSFVTLTNPSAITFPRINADNTVTALSASAFTTAIGAGHVYSDTMSVSAGVLRTKATTITTEPYSIQIFTSGGSDITHAVSDSIALDGGVYKLYVYSVDAITGAKIKILY